MLWGWVSGVRGYVVLGWVCGMKGWPEEGSDPTSEMATAAFSTHPTGYILVLRAMGLNLAENCGKPLFKICHI